MKAVLFDMDGVLIDSEIFYMKGTFDWIRKRGFNGKLEDTYRLVGEDMKETYNLIYEMLDGRLTLEEIEQENKKYFFENSIDYNKILNPFVKDILFFLKENRIKISLCSSSPKKIVEKVLLDCKIYDFFDFVISADDVKKTKPNPEIYLKACEKLKVSPDDCYIIEDSKIGIQAGKSANIKVIAIKDKYFNQNQTKADFIFNDLNEIKEFFKNKIK